MKLTNSSQEIQALENRHQTSTVLEQQLTQMKEALHSLNNEKDEVSKQYQHYVEQLDERNKKVINEVSLFDFPPPPEEISYPFHCFFLLRQSS